MSPKVLYLTPYPPERSGIADYAEVFKRAVEENTHWQMVVDSSWTRVTGNSFHDLQLLRRRVQRWEDDGTLASVALVHAELGFKHHDEFYTLEYLRSKGIPYCATLHDPPLVVAPLYFPLTFGSGWKRVRHVTRLLDYTPAGRLMLRRVLGGAAGLFVLSRGGCDVMRPLLPQTTPLYTLPFPAPLPTSETRATTAGANRPVSILFVGYWGKEKGIEILLRSFEKVSATSSTPVRLLLGGGLEKGGVNSAYVEQILGKIRALACAANVDVLGYLSEQELTRAFLQADILVVPYLPARGWGASSSLIRGMAAGVAVIATQTGILGEEIEDGTTGLLVAPNDADALTTAILRLVAEEPLRARLGRQARAHIAREHSEAVVGAQAGDIYDAIVRSANQPEK